MEPGTPCPYQRVGNDGGCRKRKKTLDVKLVKLLGFLVGESRKTPVVITHRISPVSWPYGRYHENPPWPEMTQNLRATFVVFSPRTLARSCQRSLLGRVPGTTHDIGGDPVRTGAFRIPLGTIA